MKRSILVILSLLMLTAGAGFAQDIGEEDAIATAATSSEFAGWLEYESGWSAAAYDTGNAYGVWRVQFWDTNGEDLGWADVNPALGRVYSWEAYFDLNDTLNAAAEPVVREFLSRDPNVLELIESPEQYEMYLDFDGSSGVWGAYIERAENSLYITFDFEDDLALTEPRLIRIYFSNVLSYEEWSAANEAKAAVAAFALPQVATVVRDHTDWSSSAEHIEGNLWRVTFWAGGRTLAEATVDVVANTVIDVEVGEA